MILFGVSLLFGRLILCTDLGLVLIEEWFCGILFGMVGAILWVNLVRNSGFVVAVCAGMDCCCWKIYWRWLCSECR